MSPFKWILTLSGLSFLFFMIGSGVFFLNQVSTQLTQPGASFLSSGFRAGMSFGAVGVIEIKGEILDSKKTLESLDRAAEEKQIKAVVLRLNSPGGAVAPSQEIYEGIKAFKKPLVVSMGSVAASGAYYIACGSKYIFANPGTLTGSIGVIMQFANLEKLYEWAKVKRYSIQSGKYKDSGSEFRAMRPEEKKLFQNLMEDVLTQFKQAVIEGRQLTAQQVAKIADGRIFSGNQAKQMHLVDQLGTLQQAIEEVAHRAAIPGKPRVIYLGKQKRNFIEFLMDDATRGEEQARFSSRGNLNGRGDSLGFLFAPLFYGLSLLKNDLFGVGGGLADQTVSHPSGLYWLWRGQ